MPKLPGQTNPDATPEPEPKQSQAAPAAPLAGSDVELKPFNEEEHAKFFLEIANLMAQSELKPVPYPIVNRLPGPILVGLSTVATAPDRNFRADLIKAFMDTAIVKETLRICPLDLEYLNACLGHIPKRLKHAPLDACLDDPNWNVAVKAQDERMDAAYADNAANEEKHHIAFVRKEFTSLTWLTPGVMDKKLAWLEAELTKLDIAHFRIPSEADPNRVELWVDKMNDDGELDKANALAANPVMQKDDADPFFEQFKPHDYAGVWAEGGESPSQMGWVGKNGQP